MNIKDNLIKIKEQIEDVAQQIGRNPNDITILAVTKTRSIVDIEEAITAGLSIIGENRIQEAEEKIPFLQTVPQEFHFIGHLQSNKISKLMALKPALIHSIDKFSTAEKLNEYLIKRNLTQNILIQVNTSGESTKSGITPNNAITFLKELTHLSNIKIKGLMTIGTLTENEMEIRRCFKKLKNIFDEIITLKIPNVEMKYLSMGMSGDFKIAIEEGANIIRLGTAIFGNRI